MTTTTTNGIEIYFETYGEPTDPTVLLVSGLGAQCLSFDALMCERIAAGGYHVVRYDNRDVGLSTHLEGAPSDVMAFMMSADGEAVEAPYVLSDMAEDGMGLLDSLGVASAHVVGTSMGGMIAQTMAIRHPDRVQSLTSVYSTSGEADVGNPDPEVLGSLLSIMVPPRTRPERIENGVVLARLIGSPDVFDEQLARERTAVLIDRCYDPDGTGRQMIAVMASGSRASALVDLDVPTVVLHGDRDPLIDISGGRRTAELIPGAEFRVLEGMGHDMPMQYWDRLVAGVHDNAAAAVAN